MQTNDRVEITLELSPKLVAYLNEMVKIGLWGDTIEQVCERLICQGIERAWPMLPPTVWATVADNDR